MRAALIGMWRGPNGTGGVLPASFFVEGWVDTNTLFGRLTHGVDHAVLVHQGGAQPTLEDLHFTGNFGRMLN